MAGRLTELYNQIDSVLLRSGNKDLTVIRSIAFETSQEGGLHRVKLMDALRTAVNGKLTVTPDERVKEQPYYADTIEFLRLAAMAVGQFNR